MLDARRLGGVSADVLGLLEAAFDGVAVYQDRRIAQASEKLKALLGRDPVTERLLAQGTGLRSPTPGWDLHWIGGMQALNGQLVDVAVFGMSATWDSKAAFVMAVRRREAPVGNPARDDATRQLTQRVSNGINNELGALLGNLELALERALGPAERNMVQDARKAALSATALFGELQLLSGNAHMIRELQELDAVLRRVAPTDCELDLTLGRTKVDVDAARLADVLSALRSRSLDSGASTLRLTTRLRGDHACIEHIDDARRRSPDSEEREVVFSSVRRIIEEHDGEMEFHTRDDGTRVRILLPVINSPPIKTPGAQDILVVDDEANIRAVCRRALEDNGHRVHLAPSGATALEMLHQVDMVLLDISMPGMTGVEFAERAREQCPDLPMLAMTGYADSAARDALDRMGIRVLAKPWRLKTLLAEVERAMGPQA